MGLNDIDFEALYPEERRWSIVRVDTMKPPSHEECATKLYEVDSLSEADVPDQMGIIWIAYNDDGEARRLDE